MSDQEFRLGQKILIRNKLYRSSQYDRLESGSIARHHRRFWKIIDINPSCGIVIGKRTLNNGSCARYSDHVEYNPQEYFTAYLVVTDMIRNPFYSTQIEKNMRK